MEWRCGAYVRVDDSMCCNGRATTAPPTPFQRNLGLFIRLCRTARFTRTKTGKRWQAGKPDPTKCIPDPGSFSHSDFETEERPWNVYLDRRAALVQAKRFAGRAGAALLVRGAGVRRRRIISGGAVWLVRRHEPDGTCGRLSFANLRGVSHGVAPLRTG